MTFVDLNNALGDFLTSLSLSLFDILFNFIIFVINLVLSPINFLLDSFFPSFTDLISNFNNFVLYFASMPLVYFVNLIPPLTRGMLLLWLVIAISYYTLIYSYRAIVIVPTLIRKVKFW